MRRLLYVAHRLPYPPDKGERIRAFHEIVALSREFAVTLVAPSQGPQDSAAINALGARCQRVVLPPTASARTGKLRAAMSLLRGRSATEGYFGVTRLARVLAELSEAEPFDVAFSYCTGILPACLAAAARVRAIDFVDVDSRKWLDYAEQSAWPMSMIFRREAQTIARLERLAIERCDAAFITSSAEAQFLPVGAERTIPIGVGVDSEYFQPGAGEAIPQARDDNSGESPAASLVFTGWMNYKPNIDGVYWFVREVLPPLRQRLGNVRFTIVGSSPTEQVRALATEPGITVTGRVPDVRPYLNAADAAVVPLRIARGVQNKVMEAMAMGKPVVASGGALTGLGVEPGRDCLQADSPDQWIAAILSLIDDVGPSAMAADLSKRARQIAVERFNWDAVLRPMVETCVALADGEPATFRKPAEQANVAKEAGT